MMNITNALSTLCLILTILLSSMRAEASCTGVEVSDSLELVALFNNNAGPVWQANTDWFEGPISAWTGVGLTDDGCHVKSLSLGNYGLVGQIPDPQLPELEWLDITYNTGLTGNIPDFAGIPKVKVLYLFQAELEGTIPNFTNLPDLERLDFSDNNLSGSLPDFEFCPKLINLNAESNQFTGQIPALSGDFLTNLSLQGNQFDGVLPDFTGLTALRFARFEDNQIGGAFVFPSSETIAVYNVSNNLLTGPLPEIQSPGLWTLDVSGNQLSGALPSLAGMPELVQVTLCPNDFVGGIPLASELPPNLLIENIDTDCIDGASYTGSIYHDQNGNCQFDEGEPTLQNIPVFAEGGEIQTLSGEDGEFNILLETGIQEIAALLPNSLWAYSCPEEVPVVGEALSYDDDIVGIDFGLIPLSTCPMMTVEISTLILRRCFDTQVYVEFCNQGTLMAEGAYVDVFIPEGNTLTGASLPFEQLDSESYRFDIGNVDYGSCDRLTIDLTVDCDVELGSGLCLEASVYPNEPCEDVLPLWDGSDIEVRGFCEGESVIFQISNRGLDMTESNIFKCYEDDILSNVEGYQLEQDETFEVIMPANGHTHRLKAICNEGNPFRTFSQDAVEACGPNPHSLGFLNTADFGFLPGVRDKICGVVIGAYDPNDKQVSPAGIGEQRFVSPDQQLDFKIRFQNTGNDTAFTVVLVDTINTQYLDPTSLETRMASHDYTYLLNGNIATWTFNNILLPDSGVNQLESNGFVEFSLKQRAGNPDGISIQNFADIYFDFNDPVRTNTTYNTVCSDFDFLGLESLVNLQEATMTSATYQEGEQTTVVLDFGLESESLALEDYETSIDGNIINLDLKFSNAGIGCAPNQTEISEFIDLAVLPPGEYTINIQHNFTANLVLHDLSFTVIPGAPLLAGGGSVEDICLPSSGLSLAVEGDGIIWYSDGDLTLEVGQGNEMEIAAGTTEVFVTQTVNGVNSLALTLSFQTSLIPEFEPIASLCEAGPAPELSTTSLNGLLGTWTPATIEMSLVGSSTYTFVPNMECAESIILEVTVNPVEDLVFDGIVDLCQGTEAPTLPQVDQAGESISGIWDPAEIDVETVGLQEFYFYPEDPCQEAQIYTVLVEALEEPAFEVPTEFCLGSQAFELPLTTTEGDVAAGSWEPAFVDTESVGFQTYSFIPAEAYCAEPVLVEVEIVYNEINITYEDGKLSADAATDLSYQWFLGDLFVGEGPSFVPFESGFYYALGIDEDGCTSFSELVEVTLTAVAIQELSEFAVEVFPNPASEKVNIILNTKESVWLNIINIQGQSMHEQRIEGNAIIDVQEIPSGLYLLEVTERDSKTSLRILIE